MTSDGHFKLTDFGISWFLDDSYKSFTNKETILGSPIFMSPELWEVSSTLDVVWQSFRVHSRRLGTGSVFVLFSVW